MEVTLIMIIVAPIIAFINKKGHYLQPVMLFSGP